MKTSSQKEQMQQQREKNNDNAAFLHRQLGRLNAEILSEIEEEELFLTVFRQTKGDVFSALRRSKQLNQSRTTLTSTPSSPAAAKELLFLQTPDCNQIKSNYIQQDTGAMFCASWTKNDQINGKNLDKPNPGELLIQPSRNIQTASSDHQNNGFDDDISVQSI